MHGLEKGYPGPGPGRRSGISMLSANKWVRPIGVVCTQFCRRQTTNGMFGMNDVRFLSVFQSGSGPNARRISSPLFLNSNYFHGLNPLPPVLQAPYGICDIVGFNNSGMMDILPNLPILPPSLNPSTSLAVKVAIDEPEHEFDADTSILAVKRTYQPSTIKRKRRHGFRYAAPIHHAHLAL